MDRIFLLEVYLVLIDTLCDDCSGTFTFKMRSSFASLILYQVRHKFEGECTRTRLPMTITFCWLLCQWSPKSTSSDREFSVMLLTENELIGSSLCQMYRLSKQTKNWGITLFCQNKQQISWIFLGFVDWVLYLMIKILIDNYM